MPQSFKRRAYQLYSNKKYLFVHYFDSNHSENSKKKIKIIKPKDELINYDEVLKKININIKPVKIKIIK